MSYLALFIKTQREVVLTGLLPLIIVTILAKNNLLKQNPSEEIYFNQLSFSNRKEYVEWIITAKQAETRTKRLVGAIEKLKNKWKNPTTKH